MAQETIGALAARAAALDGEIRRLEAARAVKRLQRAFGYYLDQAAWEQAAELFTHDGTIEVGLDGVYRGRERVRQYLCTLVRVLGGRPDDRPRDDPERAERARDDGARDDGGRDDGARDDGAREDDARRRGVRHGDLHECFQLQPVVTIAKDGRSARARWRTFLMAGRFGERAFWGEGPMEVRYAGEDGVWKIASLHAYQTFVVPYEGGWVRNADATGGRLVSPRLPPDAPPTEHYETWPGVHTPPFHYDCPVEALHLPREPALAGPDAALANALAALEQRVLLLHDAAQIENLVSAYGYYLDKQQWDALARLFSEDATMEISQRGVYVGRRSIRKALELFGPQGIERGRVHNHMQLQPVIHVAPDRRRAWVRSRALSQLGIYQSGGLWHGGVYENELVNEDGLWRFRTDHVYTTYFAHYEQGWMTGARPTPKPSDKLPPDRPATETYESFPEVYVPPYHYAHRVALTPSAETGTSPASGGPLAQLAGRVQRLEDERAIENLQRCYGYFVDKALWREAAELFAERGTLEIGGRGVFAGRARVLDYLRWLEPSGLARGKLFDHLQLQPIVTVAPDGLTARGRWRFLAQVGDYQKSALWGVGTYENAYVKERGVWKIETLHSLFRMYTPYADGWAKTALPNTRPEKTLPPDRPPSIVYEMYPATFIPPCHYPHPVTGT